MIGQAVVHYHYRGLVSCLRPEFSFLVATHGSVGGLSDGNLQEERGFSSRMGEVEYYQHTGQFVHCICLHEPRPWVSGMHGQEGFDYVTGILRQCRHFKEQASYAQSHLPS